MQIVLAVRGYEKYSTRGSMAYYIEPLNKEMIL